MNLSTRTLKLIISIGLIVLSGNLSAQRDLSLLEAIQIGLENNYQIQISEQELEIAKNNNTLGAAGFWPAINVGLGLRNRYDNAPAIQDPEGERQKYVTNTFSPYADINWTLFRGFGVQLTKQQLALLEELTEGNATVVVENTIQGIILAYYKVLLDQEKLGILAEVKELSGDRYLYNQYKKELGAAVTYDVLQANNSFLSDSTNYLLQELNLINSKLILKLLLGVEPEVQFNLTDKFEVSAHEYVLDDMMSTMLENNSLIRNQYINQEILKKDIKLAKSNILPTLGLNAGVDQFNTRTQQIDQGASYSNNFDFYLNLTLNFNLFNGGNTRRTIQNSKISEIIGQLEIRDLTRSLSNLMVNNYELYNIRKQLYMVAVANLESNQLNLEISGDKFRSGAINSFNYRDIQLQFLNAAFNRLEAVYNMIDTQTELLRLTGGILSGY